MQVNVSHCIFYFLGKNQAVVRRDPILHAAGASMWNFLHNVDAIHVAFFGY